MAFFKLDEDQITKLKEWHKSLLKKYPDVNRYGGAIGGSETYYFTPTSLGIVVKVKDAFTGEEIDLTDYAMW